MTLDQMKPKLVVEESLENGVRIIDAHFEYPPGIRSIDYWLTRPYEERWAAGEELRQAKYDYNVDAKMERKFTRIIKYADQ